MSDDWLVYIGFDYYWSKEGIQHELVSKGYSKELILKYREDFDQQFIQAFFKDTLYFLSYFRRTLRRIGESRRNSDWRKGRSFLVTLYQGNDEELIIAFTKILEFRPYVRYENKTNGSITYHWDERIPRYDIKSKIKDLKRDSDVTNVSCLISPDYDF